MKLNYRKANHILSRFIERLRDIWYIGAMCFIIIVFIVSFGFYSELKGYLPSIINIVIIVYLVTSHFFNVYYHNIMFIKKRGSCKNL